MFHSPGIETLQDTVGSHAPSSPSDKTNKSIRLFLNEDESYTFTVPLKIKFAQFLEKVEEERMILLPQDQYKFLIKTDKKKTPVKMSDAVGSSSYSKASEQLVIHLHPYISSVEKTKVFGTPLELLLKREQEAAKSAGSELPQIPVVMDSCLKFINKYGLSEMGLFRLSGSLKQIEQYIRQFNSGLHKPFKPSTDPHTVSGLVKRFLRDSPEPLLTYERYDDFKQLFTNRSYSLEYRIVQLRSLVQSLPDAHYALLEQLMALLNKIATKHKEETKMGFENLSIVIGPNIMKSKVGLLKVGEQLSEIEMRNAVNVSDTPMICQTCAVLIEHYSQIFKHRSVFDETLCGLEDLQPNQIIQAPAPTQTPAPSQPATSPATTTRPVSADHRRTPSSAGVKGHLPRSIYETSAESKQEKSFRPECFRITGESLAFFDEVGEENSIALKVDREIPFDHITQVTTSASEDNHFITVVYRSKSTDGTAHICGTESEIVSLKNMIDMAMMKYFEFIRLANQQPDKFGVVMSKEEFRAKKAQKEKARGGAPAEELAAQIKKVKELQQQLGDEVQQRKFLEQRCMELQDEVKELKEQLEQASKTRIENDEFNGAEEDSDESTSGSEFESDSDDSVDFREYSE